MSYSLDWPPESPSIYNRPPLGYSNRRVHCFVSFPSCHITQRGTPAGWTLATFSTGVEYKCIHRLLLSMRKRLIEYINKDGGHIRYITYNIKIVVITCSCLYFLSTKQLNWGGLLFISMSIFKLSVWQIFEKKRSFDNPSVIYFLLFGV